MRNKVANLKIIQAINIGHFAHRILSGRMILTVWGNTSRGIFLKVQPNGLIFLSYEDFKGPFTINIQPSLADEFARPGSWDSAFLMGLTKCCILNNKTWIFPSKRTMVWHPGLFDGTVETEGIAGKPGLSLPGG